MAGMELDRFDQDLSKDDVVIYSLPNCVQCEAAKRFFTNNGIEFEERDLTAPENEPVYEFIRARGATQAPYIETGVAGAWAGDYRFKLEETKAKLADQARRGKPVQNAQTITSTPGVAHTIRQTSAEQQMVQL